MKTSLDIPENELQDAMRFTGAKTKREAIVTALMDFNKRKRMAELVDYSAVSETLMSNEEIENLDRRHPFIPERRARRRSPGA